MKIGIDIDDTLAQTTNYLMPLAIKFDKDVLIGIVKSCARFLQWSLKKKY